MNGRRVTAGDDGLARGDWPEWHGLCGQTFALVVCLCLHEWLGGCEPSPEVWQRILARVSCSGPGPAPAASS